MSAPTTDWEAAFVAGQEGDKRAYRAFLEGAQSHLTRYFARKAPPADAADLVQEVLIALHTKRATYDPGQPLMPWMNTIAKYKWIDWLRRTKRVTHVELDENHDDPTTEANPATGHALAMLLEKIPSKQAEAIRLVKLEGLTIAEASERCGQSESLVKVNIHRGLKKLSAYVTDED
ncbi:MAG: sigma-70 family RNA polymerase sigma factor [Pacificimonas sp.]